MIRYVISDMHISIYFFSISLALYSESMILAGITMNTIRFLLIGRRILGIHSFMKIKKISVEKKGSISCLCEDMMSLAFHANFRLPGKPTNKT